MPSESELYTEWVANEKGTKLKVINSWFTPDNTGLDEEMLKYIDAFTDMLALKIQSVKPYFYYREEATQRKEDAVFHQDRAGASGGYDARQGENSSASPAPAKADPDSSTTARASETARSRNPSDTTLSQKASAEKTHYCERCQREFEPKVPYAKLCLDCFKKEHPRRR